VWRAAPRSWSGTAGGRSPCSPKTEGYGRCSSRGAGPAASWGPAPLPASGPGTPLAAIDNHNIDWRGGVSPSPPSMVSNGSQIAFTCMSPQGCLERWQSLQLLICVSSGGHCSGARSHFDCNISSPHAEPPNFYFHVCPKLFFFH